MSTVSCPFCNFPLDVPEGASVNSLRCSTCKKPMSAAVGVIPTAKHLRDRSVASPVYVSTLARWSRERPKTFIAGIVGCVALFIGLGLGLEFLQITSNRPKPPDGSQSRPFTSGELDEESLKDPKAFRAKYHGKTIYVRGRVVGSDFVYGTRLLQLGSTGKSAGVYVNFLSPSDAGRAGAYRYVLVRGDVDANDHGGYWITRADLIDQHD